ncbi:MAG: DUF4932 domain-containing protein, partial [bacterium]|nr:DUF4932 domain-containing protein [bacterium]
IDKHADQLEAAGSKIFGGCRKVMERQAYGGWKTMMYESLVRACVVRFQLANEGEASAEKAIQYQHGRGFKWTGGLSKLLDEYEKNRSRYKNFDDFMPRVIEFFNQYADEHNAPTGGIPTVVKMIPENGATDVDPDLKEIRVTFDQPMTDGNWAVVGGGPDFPEKAGASHYDKTRRIFIMPVRLKPNWTYHFWLNSDRYTAFESEGGVSLEPVEVTFTTRSK